MRCDEDKGPYLSAIGAAREEIEAVGRDAVLRGECSSGYVVAVAILDSGLSLSSALPARIGQEALNSFAMIAYLMGGQRILETSKGLSSRLVASSLRGLNGDDVRWPFDSQYIQLPRGDLTMDGLAVLGIFVTTAIHVLSQCDGTRECWFTVVCDGTSDGTDEKGYGGFWILLRDGEPVGDSGRGCVDKELSRLPAWSSQMKAECRATVSWLVNFAMYSRVHASDGKEVCANREWRDAKARMDRAPKGSGKYERARAIVRSLDPQRRVVFGEGMKPLQEEARHLAVRTLVMGHWQRFAVGRGRTDRRWGWRQPFWRGPADAEEHNPKRVLTVGFERLA